MQSGCEWEDVDSEVVSRGVPQRSVMPLLWFPEGGIKCLVLVSVVSRFLEKKKHKTFVFIIFCHDGAEFQVLPIG